jgi:hypothetical protein
VSDVEIAPWWPPKVGDKLRHATQHSAGDMRIKSVHALVHVVSVFEHDGDTLAVVAEWFPGRRRWNYEIIRGWTDATWAYWPDGSEPPEKHRRCTASAER